MCPEVAVSVGMSRRLSTSVRRTRGRSARHLAAALALLTVVVGTACDRDVTVVGDDPLEVEAANAGMDALLVTGPTARRVAAHRLTPERVERWFAAQEALEAQAADDPTLAVGAEPGSGDDAIARAVAALEDRPGAADIIREAGLDVEEFVLTGLALHQALTAAGPAAPAEVRRLAARNVRFVNDHADLLARFRTQRGTSLAAAPEAAPADSVWWYDPFADSLVYGIGPAAAPAPDTLLPDTLPPDSLPPRTDTLPVPPPPPLPPPR